MKNIHRLIEQTNLSPTLTDKDIDQLVEQAKTYNFIGICLPPFWVKRAARDLKGGDIQLITVAGFPLGYQMTETKIEEIKIALKDGCNEIDLVMNISAFKTKLPWVKIEIAKCAKLIHDHEAIMKVIIETAYLEKEEIVQACRLCADAGVDYVKTSTGFAPNGAKLEDIKLMRETLPSSVGIKASGGIKTLEQAKKMIEAGADRIGTSSGVQIMRETLEK
jgi:deoxyribose-phosphate aldolase